MRKLASASKNPNIWKKEVTCSGKGWVQIGTPCYGLFEVNASDIKKRYHTDISGVTDEYYGFICPECGCFTEISSNEIPYEVKGNAKEY